MAGIIPVRLNILHTKAPIYTGDCFNCLMNSSKLFFYIKCPQFTPLRKVGKDCPAGTLGLLVGLGLLRMVSDTLINHLHSWFMTRGEKALLPPTWGIFDNQNIEMEINDYHV